MKNELENKIKKLQRYELGGYPEERYIEESEDGEYIKYEDVMELIKEK